VRPARRGGSRSQRQLDHQVGSAPRGLSPAGPHTQAQLGGRSSPRLSPKHSSSFVSWRSTSARISSASWRRVRFAHA
jgi:hypothetical protein